MFYSSRPRRRHVVPAHVVRYSTAGPVAAVLGVAPTPLTVTVPVTIMIPGPTTTVPTTVTEPGPTVTIPTTVTVTVPLPPGGAS